MLALLYVVVLSTLLGFGAWAWLLGRHPASNVAPFTLLVPVVGIATAWIALGEVPSGAELAGAAVVLGGLALTVGLTAPGAAEGSRIMRALVPAAAFLALTAAPRRRPRPRTASTTSERRSSVRR